MSYQEQNSFRFQVEQITVAKPFVVALTVKSMKEPCQVSINRKRKLKYIQGADCVIQRFLRSNCNRFLTVSQGFMVPLITILSIKTSIVETPLKISRSVTIISNSSRIFVIRISTFNNIEDVHHSINIFLEICYCLVQ